MKNIFAYILIIIVVITAGGISVWQFWPSISSPTVTPSPSFTIDETANPVADYLKGAELQCEEIQRENIAVAFNDVLNLSAEELKEKRYKDYTGKENQWDLPTLIYKHFVPVPPVVHLGDDFFNDVKLEEAQEEIRQILEKHF
ncbi:hypothetical protein KKC63_03335 [Patescibacteria group bacterium]|nr:hypothetical protein [Patescibacteria group bacterium]MBU4023419.1 hypothetical protein [Patescibacteria group bacterium]MBU4078000.1 hypothetical protein [Patescibacteria group bacterium]